MNTTNNQIHRRWAKSLALQGLVVITVDFRNAYTPEKHNPFPAGLNDCAAAVKWASANRAILGISKLIVQGESGGGNLTLATTLKANREGWISSIDGVYSIIPCIGIGYDWSDERKRAELPSLIENEGYFLNAPMLEGAGWYYSPNDMENPLAWPYFASEEDLKGLPPHRISMDELDPLRDGGIAYARKLAAAGVDVAAHTNLGVVHGTALIFRQALPALHKKEVQAIASFAKSL